MATQPNTQFSSGRQQQSAPTPKPFTKSAFGGNKAVGDQLRQQRAIQLKVAGWTYAQIGRELGVTRQYVQQQLVRPSVQTLDKLYERAKWHCEICGVAERSGHVHHVRPQEDYNALDNLLYLCSSCHRIEDGLVSKFTSLPFGPERRAASEAFIQPYLKNIDKRYCLACGADGAHAGLCKECKKKASAIGIIRSHLKTWRCGEAKNAEHCLSRAIWLIRKHNLKPADFAPNLNFPGQPKGEIR